MVVVFASWRLRLAGFHGGPATARTVAVVGGGHPCVPAIARTLTRRRPHLADWAPTVASILGLDLAPTDGHSLA